MPVAFPEWNQAGRFILWVRENEGESRVRLYLEPVVRIVLMSFGRHFRSKWHPFVMGWRRMSVTEGLHSTFEGFVSFRHSMIISWVVSEARG